MESSSVGSVTANPNRGKFPFTLNHYSFTSHTDQVAAVALSVDDKLVLSGSRDGSLRLWDVASGEALCVFQNPGGAITAVAVSPDGRWALSGSQDKSVRLWRLPLTCEQAIDDLTVAIRLEPASVSAHVLRGSCYLQQACYDQALADVSKAIALDAKCKEAYLGRSLIYAHHQDHDKALGDLIEALRIDPGYAQAYYHRGLLYAEKEDYARAKADLDKAFQIDPTLSLK
jgi:hypothetical protein